MVTFLQASCPTNSVRPLKETETIPKRLTNAIPQGLTDCRCLQSERTWELFEITSILKIIFIFTDNQLTLIISTHTQQFF